MNKKQWFVLGIGLIVISLYLGYLNEGSLNTCNIMSSLIEETNARLSELGSSDEVEDISVFNCYENVGQRDYFRKFIGGLGIIFIILGFLEPKRKSN